MADLSNVALTDYESEVHMAYQASGGEIIGAVRMKNNVVGNTAQFPKSGILSAQEMGFRTPVGSQNLSFNKVDVTLKKYGVAVMSDDIEMLTVNFDERFIIVEETVKAVRRRQDQLIIDSWNNASLPSNNQIGVSYGTGTDTNLTWDKMRHIAGVFNANNVPKMDRHLAIGTAQDEFLLDIAQFTDRDYASVARTAIDNGSLDGTRVLGMQIHVIGEETVDDQGDTYGLPYNSSTKVRTCFAWHQKSTGFAMGQNFRSFIERVPKEDSHQILTRFYGQAVVIDTRGVISIACDEDNISA